jgi:hypothetical protein
MLFLDKELYAFIRNKFSKSLNFINVEGMNFSNGFTAFKLTVKQTERFSHYSILLAWN